MAPSEDYADALGRIKSPLVAVTGLLVALHGVGRYAGLIPAEPAPSYVFVTIGLLLIAEVVTRD